MEEQTEKDSRKVLKPRYEIKNGRFGAYFYDNLGCCDLDLKAVLRKLHMLDLFEFQTREDKR